MKHIKQYNTKDNTYNKLYDIISINGRLNIEKLLIYKTNIVIY